VIASSTIALSTLAVAGSGEADSPQPDLFEARTRATVRYADPAAWITAAAIANAISSFRDELAGCLHQVGVVVVSDQGPTATMAEVNAATANGFSSPLRYAASSPGSLAGVACIAFGFRGPTLNFTMCPADGVPVALQLCDNWLSRGVVRYMVLATFNAGGPTAGLSRALLLAHPELTGGRSHLLTAPDADWLMETRE
jgi:hypothetical protein